MERGENPPTGKQSRFHDSTIPRFHDSTSSIFERLEPERPRAFFLPLAKPLRVRRWCFTAPCESRAAKPVTLDNARAPRVRGSSTNDSSFRSRAGHLVVGETRSRFSDREGVGGTQVRFVTPERSRWARCLLRPHRDRRAWTPRLRRSSERAREKRNRRRHARDTRSTFTAVCSPPSNAVQRALPGTTVARILVGHHVCSRVALVSPRGVRTRALRAAAGRNVSVPSRL